MQSVKIACVRCSQRRQCPSKTRMFINYCGSASREMHERINNAVLECRLRKGYLFKQDFAIHAPVIPSLAAAHPGRRAA
jgi:hypothetical protein